jgi:hypothetical protein
MHLLHALCGAHLHHVTVAVCHLRSIRHPDPPLRLQRRPRSKLRHAAPFIVALAGGSIALCKRWGNGERGGSSRNDGSGDLERLHDTIPLANNRGLAAGLANALRTEGRAETASLTAEVDQPRIVGGSGSGFRSLPCSVVVVVQNAIVWCGTGDDGIGGASRRTIGTTQPIAAIQSSVSPLQGLPEGCCS